MAVTSASERRRIREEGIEITFPEYKEVVAIRPMDETFFLRRGMIPDFLAPAVKEMISTGEVKLPPVDNTLEWLDFLDELVKFAFVHPKVVSAPQGDDEISIEDVGYYDKVFLYGWFAQPAHVLRTFRDQQKQRLAVVDDAKAVGDPAQQTPQNPKVGE